MEVGAEGLDTIEVFIRKNYIWKELQTIQPARTFKMVLFKKFA